MLARLIVLAWLCIGCGRLGFEDVAPTDANDSDSSDSGDSGTPREGVMVAAYEVTMDAVTKDVAIDAIDPSRTLVLCDSRSAASGSGKLATCHLASPTIVSVTVGVADPTVIVRLQIIELPVGTVVQRGMGSVGSAMSAYPIPIQTVDLASSFAVISRWASLDVTGLDPRYAMAALLTDPQTLTLSRTDTGNTVHVAWQVVQLPGARVVSGLATMGIGLTTGLYATQPVDPARAFVVMSSRINSSVEAEYLVRATVNGSTLTLTRNDSLALVEVAFFIVELPNVTVQSGTTATGSLLSVTATLNPVDPTRTAVFLTASGGRIGNTSDYDEVICTGTITPTQLELRRNPSPGADVNAAIGWNVVSWPAP